jgi:hypothetical protein
MHNAAYCKCRIANDRITISLILEMATDGSAARWRQTFVWYWSRSGTLPASRNSDRRDVRPNPSLPISAIAKPSSARSPLYPSLPRASRPKPRAFFSCPKSVQESPDGFSPAAVKPYPTARHPGPETRNPSPQPRVKVGQGQSNLALPPGTPDPRPKKWVKLSPG